MTEPKVLIENLRAQAAAVRFEVHLSEGLPESAYQRGEQQAMTEQAAQIDEAADLLERLTAAQAPA